MAETNFGSLLDEQKTAWSKDVWKTARQNSFIMQLTGEGMNSAIERITELTKSEKGTRAVITLVPDLVGDGVVGDYSLEGNEEAAKAYDYPIRIDQLRNANKSAGRMAEQKVVVKFRETSRDLLGFWLSDRVDQIASLTAAGVDYRLNTNGSLRSGFTHDGTNFVRNTTTAPVGKALYDLEYSADVTAPTGKRHFRWDAGAKALKAGSTVSVTASDTLSYAALVELKAHAKDRRIKSVKAGGMELYHVFLHPKAMAKLKLDPDFLANVRNAGVRGQSNPLFSGSIVTVDGLVLHEWTHSFNTLGATNGVTHAASTADTADTGATYAGRPGFKWGANADVEGNRVLLMGAQALAFADIGIPEWDERDHFDYGAKPGIGIAKICGFRKPVFFSPVDNGDQDFGVIALDVAI